MELRYLGFDQKQSTRAYRFEGLTQGEPTIQLVVTADLGMFLEHRIGIQEGPSLCAHKLASDAQTPRRANLGLTSDDLRALVEARVVAVNRKAELRRSGPRRHYPNTKHISDCDLKRYHLGKLGDKAALAPIEEHLLACRQCAVRAEATVA